MTLIISKNGKNAQKVPRSVIEKEGYLQQYIYDNPESVPLGEIDDSIRLFIVAREVPTDSGPIDAFGLDADGTIYLIETKLYKNPDKRLVVAQVLDYGAALREGSADYESLLRILDDKAKKQFGCGVNEKLAEFFDLDEEGVDTLLANMKACLDKGSFRFVVLMDTIHARLKDLITFINENSRFTIYGVQLQYYKYKEYEIMIPSLFGAEVRKRVGVPASGKDAQRRRFWEKLVGRARGRTDLHSNQSSQQNYLATSAGRTGLYWQYIISDSSGLAELYIDFGNGRGEDNKDLFEGLGRERESIEREFGEKLVWDPMGRDRACRIRTVCEIGGLKDVDKWPDIQDDMIDRMIQLVRALKGPLERILQNGE